MQKKILLNPGVFIFQRVLLFWNHILRTNNCFGSSYKLLSNLLNACLTQFQVQDNYIANQCDSTLFILDFLWKHVCLILITYQAGNITNIFFPRGCPLHILKMQFNSIKTFVTTYIFSVFTEDNVTMSIIASIFSIPFLSCS